MRFPHGSAWKSLADLMGEQTGVARGKGTKTSISMQIVTTSVLPRKNFIQIQAEGLTHLPAIGYYLLLRPACPPWRGGLLMVSTLTEH